MAPKPGRLASILRPWGLIWLSVCLHWEALTQAVRRDGLAALGRPRQIRDAASAKLLSIACNLATRHIPHLTRVQSRLTIIRS